MGLCALDPLSNNAPYSSHYRKDTTRSRTDSHSLQLLFEIARCVQFIMLSPHLCVQQPAIATLSSPPLGQAFYPYDGLCIEFFPLFVMRLLKLALEVWSYGKQVRCSIVGSSRSLPSLRQTFAERTSAPKRQKMEGERLILSIFAVGITRGLVLGSNPNGALLAIQASPNSLSYSHQSSQH